MNLHVNEAGVEFAGQLNMNKNHDSSVLCLEPISINDVKHKTRLQEKKYSTMQRTWLPFLYWSDLHYKRTQYEDIGKLWNLKTKLYGGFL